MAKAAEAVVDPNPPDWPPDWEWPGPPWPPGWQTAVFTNISPEDGAKGVTNPVTLQWSFELDVNGEIYYADLFNVFVDGVMVDTTSGSSYSGEFSSDTHEWLIVARVGGLSYTSQTYEFETELAVSGSAATGGSSATCSAADVTVFAAGSASTSSTSASADASCWPDQSDYISVDLSWSSLPHTIDYAGAGWGRVADITISRSGSISGASGYLMKLWQRDPAYGTSGVVATVDVSADTYSYTFTDVFFYDTHPYPPASTYYYTGIIQAHRGVGKSANFVSSEVDPPE